MNLRRSARSHLLRACWMTGGAIGALVGTSALAHAQETVSYSYDALGRLVGTNTSGGPNSGIVKDTCFDAAGNRTRYSVGVGGAPCATPAPASTSANEAPVAANDLDRDSKVPLSIAGTNSDPGGM